MRETFLTRRRLMGAAGSGGALLLFSGASVAAGAEGEEQREVGAVEDLMREHGVLRRALCIYREMARKLHAGASPIDMRAIGRTAALFRRFGEEFENIEHTAFGKDGFQDAVEEIGALEAELGCADIAQFTAPPPALS